MNRTEISIDRPVRTCAAYARAAVLVLGLVLVLVLGRPAAADTWDDCMQNKDMDLKVSACTQSIDSNKISRSNRITATLHRGYAKRRLGDDAGALEDVTWVIRESPRWGHAHYEHGLLMARRDDMYTALRSFDVAVRYMADKPFAWLERGRANHALGNYWAAEQDLDEALRLRADYAPALRTRALVRCRKTRTEQALADWAHLRDLDKDGLADQAAMLKEAGFWVGATPNAVDERFIAALGQYVAAGCPAATS